MIFTSKFFKISKFFRRSFCVMVSLFFCFFLIFSCSSKMNKIEVTAAERIKSAMEQLEAGEYKEVTHTIDILIEEKPIVTSGRRLLEEFYAALSSWRKIEKCLDEWSASNPTHHSFFVLKGDHYTTKAWHHRGGDWGYTVTQKRKKDFRDYLARARINFEKAYSLSPKDPSSAVGMITVAKGLGFDKETMERWFQRAIEADPKYYSAYSAKLDYLAPKWQGSKEEYLDFATFCYNNSPQLSIIHNVMLECIIEMSKRVKDRNAFLSYGKVQQVIQDIQEKTLSDFPKSIFVRGQISYLKEMSGKHGEALNILKEALEIDPENTSLLVSAGNIILKNNMKEKIFAENAFKKVAQIDPNYAEAYFSLGQIYMEEYNDAARAIQSLDKAISLKPFETKFLIQRGTYKFGAYHDYKSAIDDFTGVVKLDPRHIDGHYCRAMAHMNLGEYVDADRDFRKALELISQERLKGDGASLPPDELSYLTKTINQSLSSIFPQIATEITPEKASLLCKKGGFVELKKLQSLSPEVAKVFSKHDGGIRLPGLSSISPEIAKIMGDHNNTLDLSGLISIDPVTAKNLAKVKGYLTLSGLTSVSPQVAKALSGHGHGTLTLNGIRSLSPQAAKNLSKVTDLCLNGLTEVSDAALVQLCQNRGNLWLSGFEKITSKQAQRLSVHEGNLFLYGLTSLSPEVTFYLGQHKGGLWFGKVTSLSSESAKHFGRHKGSLYLNKVSLLSDKAASFLREHEGEISLASLQSITPDVAELLIKVSPINIDLSQAKSITPEVAGILVKHSGVLFLGGITELDVETATILCRHQNEVFLKGLNEVKPEVMAILKKCPQANLSKKLKIKVPST
jgi:tetratricopeptide (TPR) repeat protein